MKKMLVMASLATIIGLTYYASTHTSVDDPLLVKDEDKKYIVTVDGDVLNDDAKTLRKYRNVVMNQLAYLLPEGSYEITDTYDCVMNGFAVKVNSAYASVIENIKGVSEMQETHTYALPEVVTGGSSTLATGDKGESTKELRLANYSAETMSATAADIKAITGEDSMGGKNVTIGIIDTGMYINQIEGTDARKKAESTKSLNAAAFKDLPSGSYKMADADVQSKGFASSYYTHYNNKVFFAHDYTGNDSDVDPTEKGSNHGTHVASLAGANGDDFQGIAPNAQIAVLKVFSDSENSGAGTEDIIAALNDAAKLGLDIVNLSLGSDLNTGSDSVDDQTYTAVKNATAKGTIVNFAAGNSGKSSFSSSRSYADWSTDVVETGILGSDAHYDESANIVASSNPDKAFFTSILTVQQNGSESVNAVSYKDQCVPSTTQQTIPNRPLSGLIPEGQTSTELEYVVVPGVGKSTDYEGIDVNGKIAVVHRGNITFVNKIKNAYSHGAIAMICINNDDSVTFNFSMAFEDYEPPIPVVFAFKNSTSSFGNAKQTGKLTIGTNTVQKASDGNTISSFSSDGGEYNLDMGVTISAPGKEIIGAVNATAYNEDSNTAYSYLTGYENESGTSMACPNLTGAMALYLGEKNPANGGKLAATSFDEEKKLVSMKAMSTADQLEDTSGDGTPNSPRMQGAGRVNVKDMLSGNSYLTTENKDLGGFDNVNQAKAELKNLGSLKVEGGEFETSTDANYVEFDVTLHNDSSEARTYTPSISLMIPKLRIQTTHDEYVEEEESSRKETIGYDSDVTFNEDDLSTYPYSVGQQTVTVNDDLVTIPTDHQLTGKVSVPANGTANYSVKLRIDDLQFTKSWNDSKVEDFSGTIKEYFAKYFSDAGGNYVEGFVSFNEDGGDETKTLTMPYLGFYGDYDKGSAVEPFDFEKSSTHVYTSDLVDNYMQNLNDTYKKTKAYTGSTLTGTANSLSNTSLTSIGSMNSSPVADGVDYFTVTDGEDSTHIYAGASNASQHLIATFFVLRSLSGASWSIKSGSTTKASGSIGMLYYGNSSFTTVSGGEIYKSWLVNGDESVPYYVSKGYADINVSKLDEGDYTLEFDFDVAGTGKTQTKSYNLTIDKTAPSLYSASIRTTNDNRQYIDIVSRGGSLATTIETTQTRIPTLVSGSDDLYTSTFPLSSTWTKEDRMLVEISDYAHNVLTLVLKPSNISFSIASTFFTKKTDYSIDQASVNNGVYTYQVSIFDSKTKKDIKMSGTYTLYMQLDKNLVASEIQVSISGQSTTFSYDPDTGIISFTMPASATADFSINKQVKKSDSSDTSDNGGKKKGCGGSIVAVSSSLGAVAALTAAVVLKKKKENK